MDQTDSTIEREDIQILMGKIKELEFKNRMLEYEINRLKNENELLQLVRNELTNMLRDEMDKMSQIILHR